MLLREVRRFRADHSQRDHAQLLGPAGAFCGTIEAHELRDVKAKCDALKAAGTALYMAGHWSCDRLVNEKKLWEQFRDALGLPKGTETQRAIAAAKEK